MASQADDDGRGRGHGPARKSAERERDRAMGKVPDMRDVICEACMSNAATPGCSWSRTPMSRL